jgi:hypothetical protein
MAMEVLFLRVLQSVTTLFVLVLNLEFHIKFIEVQREKPS